MGDAVELFWRVSKHRKVPPEFKSWIKTAGFKTWPGGRMNVPTLRDDMSISIMKMKVPAGMLIPARSVDGLITGLHIKPHDFGDESDSDSISTGYSQFSSPAGSRASSPGRSQSGRGRQRLEEPKYKWVSKSKSIKLPIGLVKHMGGDGSSREMPLFVCRHADDDCRTVALVEGGLKAHVFAFLLATKCRSMVPVIGAAGGQH